ncbi:tripartite motif-containing protein 16-like isoform X2 [Mustelus asterias]
MATVKLAEDSLTCTICLDYFTAPATLPCGHSFCKDCISKNWEQQQAGPGLYSCPHCRRSFSPRPCLHPNTVLCHIVEAFLQRQAGSSSSQPLAGPRDVPCDSCPPEERLRAVSSCLVCLTSYCESHLAPHLDSPAFREHRLTQPVPNLWQRRCPQHRKPLESFCRTDSRCLCWVCALSEHRGHHITTVDQEAASRQKLITARKMELQEHLQITADTIAKWKQNIDCIQESAQRVKSNALSKFTELLRAVEKAQSEAMAFIEREQRAELNHAEAAQKALEQKWTELRHEKEYLNFNEITENPSSPSSTIGLETKLGKVEQAVARLSTLIKEHFQSAWMKNLENVVSTDDEERSTMPALSAAPEEQPMPPETRHREDLLPYCYQITLDPNTIQRQLCLSEGNRRVTNIYPRSEDYELCPERFDLCTQVLCRESLSTGQFYWEVELNDGDAMIGITDKRIRRKGSENCCILGRNDFSWCIEFWYNNVSAWHDNKETRLQVERFEKIGLYLNCPAGTLSFYGVSDQISLIHQFHAVFTEPMYPAFWIYCDTTLSICQFT